MRKLSRLLLALAFAVGASAQAGAVDLTLTGGTLGVSIGALPPIQFQANSAPVLDVTDPGQFNGFTEPASIFTGDIQLPTALFTGVALINGLTIGGLANGQKTIAFPGGAGTRLDPAHVIRPGGGLGGPGPLTGSAFVNVLFLFNLTVPLNIVGNTGATTSVAAGTLFVTVLGTGWTTGTMMLTGVTTEVAGVPLNTVTYEGFDNRNANGTGVVQLISAFHVTTSAAGNLPGLATQTLSFVPEPGTILMLLSGAVTLGIGGWLRMRGR